jgi:hypothetical protein
MDTSNKPKVWFYAKQYGWGWGLPAAWQGWVVLCVYLVLIIGGIFVFDMERQLAGYIVFAGALTALLIAICWVKGEKPAWRWGAEVKSSPDLNRRGLLLFHLFLGPLLLGFALFIRTHLPPEINKTYGYRTHISMQSQEAWDEAQRYSANAMIIAALVTIIFQAASCFAMKPATSLLASGGVLILAIMIAMAATELHLKRNFDPHGAGIISYQERIISLPNLFSG